MAETIEVILNRKGKDVVTIKPDATLLKAASLLAEHKIGAVVVSPDGEAVAGILSERDVVRLLASAGAGCAKALVSEAMTAAVITADRKATVADIMTKMSEGRFRHVPVVEDDKLIGIISIGDVVKNRLIELETEADALQEYVTGSSY